MYTAVVDDISLHHFMAVGSKYASERISEKIIADVAEVKGLVGIGGGILHHHEVGVRTGLTDAEIGICRDIMEKSEPESRRDRNIKESLDHVEFLHCVKVLLQPLSDLLSCSLRTFARNLEKGEYDYSEMPLELLARRRHLDFSGVKVSIVKALYGISYTLSQYRFN